MLKFLKTDVVFQEIPNEMSLAVAISGCTIHCTGCHSRELWEDKGEPLTIESITLLLQQYPEVTCLLLMGGERDIDTLTEIFLHFHKKIKTAWYCGLDMIPKDKIGILEYLDYFKLGHFDIELGGLNSPTTNQRFYKYDYIKKDWSDKKCWKDITYKFQKNENTNDKG